MRKYLQVRKKSLPLHPRLRKTVVLTKAESFTIKELKALCKPDFPRREVLKKIFEKRFAGFKKLLYLCSPFAL